MNHFQRHAYIKYNTSGFTVNLHYITSRLQKSDLMIFYSQNVNAYTIARNYTHHQGTFHIKCLFLGIHPSKLLLLYMYAFAWTQVCQISTT